MSDTIITIRDAAVRFNLSMQKQMSLKDQMEQVIRSVPGEELRLLLFCRYMEHKTWPDIAMILNVSRNTAHSWHKTALEQVVLPESAIDIRSFAGNSVLPAPAC